MDRQKTYLISYVVQQAWRVEWWDQGRIEVEMKKLDRGRNIFILWTYFAALVVYSRAARRLRGRSRAVCFQSVS